MGRMRPLFRSGSDSDPSAPVATVVALLAVRNLIEDPLPDSAYAPTNVTLGAALVALARRGGASWCDLGLDRRNVGRALSIGATTASVALATMLVGAALPMTRGLFDDGRVPRDASGWERLYQTAIRIPVGTVAFEELAFRGVLLAVLARRMSMGAAVAVSSGAFGLWHILPTLATARANGIMGLGRIGLVAVSVMLTFSGGIVFCGLRLRGGHILAPAMLHLAFNDTGYLLAWWIRR
jgi:membrane protease YdiL (CAAX protease family)